MQADVVMTVELLMHLYLLLVFDSVVLIVLTLVYKKWEDGATFTHRFRHSAMEYPKQCTER